MTAGSFRIREARLPDDKPAILNFILALQQFEKAIEPNRRVDSTVAEEYYAVLTGRVAEKNGRILMAEGTTGAPIGWAAAHEDEEEIYVVAGERPFGHIAELYVAEEWRGQGIGRALIAACEDWARERHLPRVVIGAVYRNERAIEMYKRNGYAPDAIRLKKYLL